MKTASLPKDYETYVFDLYGTLVDINTDEENMDVWEKLSLFYGYYKANYTKEELKLSYKEIIKNKEANLKSTLEQDPKYSHEASPEIELTEVFLELYLRKGIKVDTSLAVNTGQLFRILTTKYLKLYDGTVNMLNCDNKEYLRMSYDDFQEYIKEEIRLNLVLNTACANVDGSGYYVPSEDAGDYNLHCVDFICTVNYSGFEHKKDCRID